MQYLGSVTIEQILSDILSEYAKGEILAESLDKSRKNYNEELNNIKNGYGLNNKKNKIKEYGAYCIKLNAKDERESARRYDWDSITHKDHNGNLLDHIANSILAKDEFTKTVETKKAINQIEDNLYNYYKGEFEEKIEQEKANYNNNQMQYGYCDYFEA